MSHCSRYLHVNRQSGECDRTSGRGYAGSRYYDGILDHISKRLRLIFFSRTEILSAQWRAYSERSGGYSIGFRPEYLRAVGERFLNGRSDRFFQGSDTLVRCIYCDEEEERSLREEIKKLVSAYIEEAATAAKLPVGEGIQGFRTPAALAIKHFLKLGQRSAITKDIGFREEAEWRLAFLLKQGPAVKDIEFKPGS